MGDFAMYRATCKTRERRLFSVQVCVLFLSSLAFAAPPTNGRGIAYVADPNGLEIRIRERAFAAECLYGVHAAF